MIFKSVSGWRSSNRCVLLEKVQTFPSSPPTELPFFKILKKNHVSDAVDWPRRVRPVLFHAGAARLAMLTIEIIFFFFSHLGHAYWLFCALLDLPRKWELGFPFFRKKDAPLKKKKASVSTSFCFPSRKSEIMMTHKCKFGIARPLYLLGHAPKPGLRVCVCVYIYGWKWWEWEFHSNR